MPLKISLRPDETFWLNGAEVQNSPRRAALIFKSKDVSIVRERMLLTDEEASTSLGQAYTALLIAYRDRIQPQAETLDAIDAIMVVNGETSETLLQMHERSPYLAIMRFLDLIRARSE